MILLHSIIKFVCEYTNMDDLTNDYILRLPRELILIILSYIPKFWDIIQFLSAYPTLKNILPDYDKTEINFQNEYDLNLTQWSKFFNRDFSHIILFNINNIYWIPAEEIQKSIKKMPNLLHLFIMDTELKANKQHCLFIKENCLKLETLAISIENKHWDKRFSSFISGFTIESDNLPSTIKILYIHVEQNSFHKTPVRSTFTIPFSLKKIQSLFYFTSNSDYPQFQITQKHFDNITSTPIVFKRNHFQWKELLENTLGYDVEKQNRIPFSIRDIKNIQKNDYKLENIELEEFSCNECTVNPLSHKLQYELLFSQRTQCLKKLSIHFCAVFGDIAESFNNRNLISKDEEYTFKKIIKNCTLLEELEIWRCKVYTLKEGEEDEEQKDRKRLRRNFLEVNDKYMDKNPQLTKRFIEELQYIGELKKLKKLSLILIPAKIARHDFLTTIIKNCKKLEYLNIGISLAYTREKLNNIDHLFLFLPYASQLKDLRIEFLGPFVNSLLEALNSADLPKLRRLYVDTCRQSLNVSVLRNFFEKYPQLIFFGIRVIFLPKQEIKTIQNIMDEYKTNKQKVFCIGNQLRGVGRVYTSDELQKCSAAIHKKDLVDNYTKVCVYNYFEDTFSIRSTEL